MTGGILHTGDGGSGDRRDTSYRRWWGQERYFIPEIVGVATGGILHTGDGVITLHYWNHYDGTIAIKYKKVQS